MSGSVTVIDEITLPRDRAEDWLARWRTDYLPAARERGMTVVRHCRRFTDPDAVAVIVVWEVPGIYEFYGTRTAAGEAPEVRRFWAWTDALALTRQRRVLEEIM